MKPYSRSFILAALCFSVVCCFLHADASAANAPGRTGKKQKVTMTFETVTKFVGPLNKHDADLKKIGKDISRLLSKGKPDDPDEMKQWDKDVKAVGEVFLKKGKAFLKTFTGFLKGETRRGLMIEIDLIRSNVMVVHKMLVDYRRLKGVKVTRVTKNDRAELKKLLLRFAIAQARKRIAARFDDEGLRQIVTSETLLKAREHAIAVVKKRIGVEVDKHVESATGMAFHNRRSLHRVLKQRVNRSIERQVARLMVKITGKEIVIAIGKELIGKWVKDKLWNVIWPRIREKFRRKGRHASRTARSIATMRTVRIRLAGLTGEAKRDRVIREMNQAIETALAAEYLIKDLRRGKQDTEDEEEQDDEEQDEEEQDEEEQDEEEQDEEEQDDEEQDDDEQDDEEEEEEQEDEVEDERDKLFTDLSLEIALLLQTRKNTGLRFLLHKESLVMALTVDREVLADTLRELEKILRGIEPPKITEGKMFFISPYQVPTKSGPKPNPTLPRTSYCYANFYGSLKYLDVEGMEKHREALRKLDDDRGKLTFEEFLKKHGSFIKNYKKAYIVRVTCNGQTSYTHYPAGDVRRGVWGRGNFFGLRPGVHTMAVSLTTSEGFRIDETLAFRVEFNKKDKTRWGPWLERRSKDLEASRKLLAELKGEKKVSHAGKHISNLRRIYLDKLAKFDSASPATVMKYLREIMKICEFLLKEEKPKTRSNAYVFRMMAISGWCQRLGSSEAYALAKEASGKAMSHAGNLKKSDKSKIASIHWYLANLAIATGNNVEAAVAHLKDNMTWKKNAGMKVDEKAERKTWPKEW